MLLAQSLLERDALEAELLKISPGQIALLVAPPERLPQLSFQAVLHFCKGRNMKAVFVSVTRPADTVRAELERAGLPPHRFCIIDCVSPVNPANPRRAPGAFAAESPAALTEISILIDQALKKLGEGRVVVHVDSIAMMLNWNSFENLAQFLVLTTAKLRKQGVTGLMVMPLGHEERLMAHVAPICDRMLHLSASRVGPHMVPMTLRATQRLLGHGGAAVGHMVTTFRPGRAMSRFREAGDHVAGKLGIRTARLVGPRAYAVGQKLLSDGSTIRRLPRPLVTFFEGADRRERLRPRPGPGRQIQPRAT